MASEPIFSARQAMPLENVLDQVGMTGWDVFERLGIPQDTVRAALEDRTDEVAPLLYGLYRTPEGRAFFEWLCDMTVRRPYVQPAATTIEATALYARERHGQDSVLFTILQAVARGQAIVEERRTPTRRAEP